MIKYILPLAVVLLTSCSLPGNNKYAKYSKLTNGSYKVVLTGKRVYMAHDIISALQYKKYDVKNELILPRINGHINASEIKSIKRDRYTKVTGSVDINRNVMQVNIIYKYLDKSNDYPSGWNGRYILVPQN